MAVYLNGNKVKICGAKEAYYNGKLVQRSAKEIKVSFSRPKEYQYNSSFGANNFRRIDMIFAADPGARKVVSFGFNPEVTGCQDLSDAEVLAAIKAGRLTLKQFFTVTKIKKQQDNDGHFYNVYDGYWDAIASTVTITYQ